MKLFEALGTIHTRCCATCQHWDQVAGDGVEHLGLCSIKPADVEISSLSKGGRKVGIASRPYTLDLAVCSKWQAKEDAE